MVLSYLLSCPSQAPQAPSPSCRQGLFFSEKGHLDSLLPWISLKMALIMWDAPGTPVPWDTCFTHWLRLPDFKERKRCLWIHMVDFLWKELLQILHPTCHYQGGRRGSTGCPFSSVPWPHHVQPYANEWIPLVSGDLLLSVGCSSRDWVLLKNFLQKGAWSELAKKEIRGSCGYALILSDLITSFLPTPRPPLPPPPRRHFRRS